MRGKRIRIPGSTTARGRGGMPQDLTQLAAESVLGLEHGFWGSVAAGATFRSCGRKRTRPGRAVIARNRAGLDEAEKIVFAHYSWWGRGERTPVAASFADLSALWEGLGDGGELVVEWPSLRVLGAGRPLSPSRPAPR